MSILDNLIDREPSLTLSEQLDVVVFLADEMLDALQQVESELIDVGMEVPQYVTKAIRRTKDDCGGSGYILNDDGHEVTCPNCDN